MSRNNEPDGPWINRAFNALADPVRREIIELIAGNPGVTVNEICACFSVSRFTIMRHLNVIEDAQLLYRERKGTTKHLYLDLGRFEDLRNGWLKRVITPSKL